VSELLREAVAEQRAAAHAAGVELRLRCEPESAAVSVDRMLVERALANLVSNAVKFSPAGGLVEVEARREADGLAITVTDRGPGLSEAQRAQLAGGQRGAAVGDPRGVGLGLQFVQRVAARHGGRLRALQRSSESGARMVLELSDTQSGNP
jgi:signal transduction histidine kinase